MKVVAALAVLGLYGASGSLDDNILSEHNILSIADQPADGVFNSTTDLFTAVELGGFRRNRNKKESKKESKKKHQRKGPRFKIPLRHVEGGFHGGMVGAIGVGYGDRKKEYEVVFDTQSSNMLMFHEDIQLGEDRSYKDLFDRNNQFYDPEKANTGQYPYDTHQFNIMYPDGSEYGGGGVYDYVWLGSLEHPFQYMHFAWVDYMNQVAATKRGGGFDGIVGLGTGGLLEGNGMNAIFEELTATPAEEEDNNGNNHDPRFKKRKPKPALLKKNPVFSLFVSKTGETGELMFGGHDEALVAAGKEMTYFPALRLTRVKRGEGDDSWAFWEDSEETVIIDDPDKIVGKGRKGRSKGSAGSSASSSRHLLLSEIDSLSLSDIDSSEDESSQSSASNGGDTRSQASGWASMNDGEQVVIWGTHMNKLSFGDNDEGVDDINAVFSSTIPYGVAVPDVDYLKRFVGYIKNGAQVTRDGNLIIPCDNLKSGVPDLLLTIGDHKFSFTPEEYFPEVIGGDENNTQQQKGSKKKQQQPPQTAGLKCRSFFGIVNEEKKREEGKKKKPEPIIPLSSSTAGPISWIFFGRVDHAPQKAIAEEGPVPMILGIPFMKKYYTEYGYGETSEDAQVGIVLSKGKELKTKKSKKNKKDKKRGFFRSN